MSEEKSDAPIFLIVASAIVLSIAAIAVCLLLNSLSTDSAYVECVKNHAPLECRATR